MVRSALTADDKVEIWRGYQSGASLRSISRTLGHSMDVLRVLVASTGGRPPQVRHRSTLRLTVAEREEISRGVVAGASCRTIALGIRRPGSTVSSRDRPERRSPPLPRLPGGSGCMEQGPSSQSCQTRDLSAVAAGAPKPSSRHAGLRSRSPASLRRAYPDDRELRVSHGTIYMSLFVQPRGALRKELARYLRSRRLVRRPRAARPANGQGQLRNAINISARPAEAADRAVPGHS
jgi:IS30 family transposase